MSGMLLIRSFLRAAARQHRLFALLLALILLPLGSTGHAQEGITLATMQVDLWPEYDQPKMLVIYHIGLPASLTLPVQLNLRIPAASGGPNAVAARQADGALVNAPFEVEQQGEWLAVNMTASTYNVQLEYYDAGLSINGSQRSFVYTWPGDYVTESFVLQVQQPLGASAMQISPSLGSGAAGRDGLMYYSAELGAMPSGQNFNISLGYEKASDELTISQIQVQPSGDLTGNSSGGLDTNTLLLWLAAGLGVLLILGGGWFYWQSGRASERSAARRSSGARRGPRRSSSSAGPEVQPEAEGNIYCHNCGKRAGQGDRFCRTCGTPLRSS